MIDEPKPGSMAAGRARYAASHGKRDPHTTEPAARSHKTMSGVERGKAMYRAKAGDGTAQAALQAAAESRAAAASNPFTGGDPAA